MQAGDFIWVTWYAPTRRMASCRICVWGEMWFDSPDCKALFFRNSCGQMRVLPSPSSSPKSSISIVFGVIVMSWDFVEMTMKLGTLTQTVKQRYLMESRWPGKAYPMVEGDYVQSWQPPHCAGRCAGSNDAEGWEWNPHRKRYSSKWNAEDSSNRMPVSALFR